jgi:Raf kinase inhibitor-like YbhB/YbcL family protein
VLRPSRIRIESDPQLRQEIRTMKLLPCAFGLLLSAALAFAQAPAKEKGKSDKAKAPATPGLTLTTPAFLDGAEIPSKYTQGVANPISPKLEWSHVPANTASFVLIMHDPDTAPQKKSADILHWMIINIPGTARELAEAAPADAKLPDGSIQTKNFRNTVGYLGPGAPAVGPHHHYTWELFALDTKIELGAEATRTEVLSAMDGHILGKGVLVGRFHR